MNYESYFEYWKHHSDFVCECCKNVYYFCEDNCEDFYELTKEECDERHLSTQYGIKWNCMNTDNFEFCKKFQESVCKDCLFEDDLPKFESNGCIR